MSMELVTSKSYSGDRYRQTGSEVQRRADNLGPRFQTLRLLGWNHSPALASVVC